MRSPVVVAATPQRGVRAEARVAGLEPRARCRSTRSSPSVLRSTRWSRHHRPRGAAPPSAPPPCSRGGARRLIEGVGPPAEQRARLDGPPEGHADAPWRIRAGRSSARGANPGSSSVWLRPQISTPSDSSSTDAPAGSRVMTSFHRERLKVHAVVGGTTRVVVAVPRHGQHGRLEPRARGPTSSRISARRGIARRRRPAGAHEGGPV